MVLVFAECGTPVHIVVPSDLRSEGRRDSLIAAWAPNFANLTIFVDPGHGGDDRTNMGPAKDVVEADVNLRVALRLRDLLTRAGARVVMSRDTDATVPLSARAQQANVNNADMFVSIHHNAAQNDQTNYTATFYHARPGDMAYKASSHDLARYIQRDLSYAMGVPGGLASFDGTMSDFDVAPNGGFHVLRETRMTAVLVECSFFTSAYEEQRLKREDYNDIQAWGIFRGITRYLQAGIPVLRYASPTVFASKKPTIDIEVSDRSDIRDESVRVFINGREEGFSYSRKSRRITVTPTDELSDGHHLLSAQVRNAGGNSSAPFEMYFAVGRAPAALRSTAEPAMVPESEDAYSVITITAVDSAGAAVPDGLPLRFRTSAGVDTMLVLRNGAARIPLYPAKRARVTFSASNGPVKTEGAVTTSPDARYTRGFIVGADGQPVAHAVVELPGGRTVTASEAGEYVIAGASPTGIEITIRAPGWYTRREAITPQMVQDPIILSPVANGVLRGVPIILELLTAKAESDGSRADGRILRALADLLEASGARVVLLHEYAGRRRDSVLASLPTAALVQIGEQAAKRATIRVNTVPASLKLAHSLVRMLGVHGIAAIDKTPQRISAANAVAKRTQLALLMPRADARGYESRALPWHAAQHAWSIYQSLAAAAGYAPRGTRTIEAVVTERTGGAPAAYAPVELNGTLRGVTDARGICIFRWMSTPHDDVRAASPDIHTVTSVKTVVE